MKRSRSAYAAPRRRRLRGRDLPRPSFSRAYAGFGHDARAPLKQLDANHFLLELFHGPTLAFKDFAMQLIGQMFETSLTRSGRRDHL